MVSDLTERNPNVLYETGLAHALDRDVVTIVQNDQDCGTSARAGSLYAATRPLRTTNSVAAKNS